MSVFITEFFSWSSAGTVAANGVQFEIFQITQSELIARKANNYSPAMKRKHQQENSF